MAQTHSRGWYIVGFGKGGVHGPKAAELSEKARKLMPPNACSLYGASSTRPYLVYGNPVTDAFDFWRASDPLSERLDYSVMTILTNRE